jgi:hypothetical protein
VLTVPDQGIAAILDILRLAFHFTDPPFMRLFVNDISPTVSSLPADFHEATFPGYAAQGLVDWSAPTVSDHVATTTNVNALFERTVTGIPQLVYGYYVTDASRTVLMWAERDPAAPRSIGSLGDIYIVTPSLTCQNLIVP